MMEKNGYLDEKKNLEIIPFKSVIYMQTESEDNETEISIDQKKRTKMRKVFLSFIGFSCYRTRQTKETTATATTTTTAARTNLKHPSKMHAVQSPLS